jgi:hypothetical protein
MDQEKMEDFEYEFDEDDEDIDDEFLANLI